MKARGISRGKILKGSRKTGLMVNLVKLTCATTDHSRRVVQNLTIETKVLKFIKSFSFFGRKLNCKSDMRRVIKDTGRNTGPFTVRKWAT